MLQLSILPTSPLALSLTRFHEEDAADAYDEALLTERGFVLFPITID